MDVDTLRAVVVGNLASAAVESMASTSLAALGAMDMAEEISELISPQRRVGTFATVDGGAMVVGERRILVVDNIIRVAVGGIAARFTQILIAVRRTMAVVTVGKNTRDGGNGDGEERESLDHFI